VPLIKLKVHPRFLPLELVNSKRVRHGLRERQYTLTASIMVCGNASSALNASNAATNVAITEYFIRTRIFGSSTLFSILI
jgi:hypothetical protein